MILWIDDDISVALNSYFDELEVQGYHVLRIESPDALASMLRTRNETWKAVIVDVMMPTGKSIDLVKANAGMYTGIELVKMFRHGSPFADLAGIPVIFLTISDDEYVNKFAEKCGFPLLRKEYIVPSSVIEELKRLGIEPDVVSDQ